MIMYIRIIIEFKRYFCTYFLEFTVEMTEVYYRYYIYMATHPEKSFRHLNRADQLRLLIPLY